jgi:hypothetical protein
MCCINRLARLTLAQGGLSSSYNVRFVRLYNTSTSEATWFIIEIVMYGLAALLFLFEMYKFWFLRSRHYLKFRSWISIINYLSVALSALFSFLAWRDAQAFAALGGDISKTANYSLQTLASERMLVQ